MGDRMAFDFPDSNPFNTESALGSTYLAAAYAPFFCKTTAPIAASGDSAFMVLA
jgi:hypothetical protein